MLTSPKTPASSPKQFCAASTFNSMLLATPPYEEKGDQNHIESKNGKNSDHETDECRSSKMMSSLRKINNLPSEWGSPELPPKNERRNYLGKPLQTHWGCGLCNGSEVITANAISLDCGHAAHCKCVEKIIFEDSKAVCQYCTSLSFNTPLNVPPFENKSESRASSVYEEMEIDQLTDDDAPSEVLQPGFSPTTHGVTKSPCKVHDNSVITSDCQLDCHSYFHYTSSRTAELLVDVSSKSCGHLAHYEPSAADDAQSIKYTSLVSWATDLSDHPLKGAVLGKVKMHTIFFQEVREIGATNNIELWAYLCERHIVILRPDKNSGFEDLYRIFYLDAVEFNAYLEGEYLVLHQGEPLRLLALSSVYLVQWILAINNRNLLCPANLHDAMNQGTIQIPKNPDMIPCGYAVEQVLCLRVGLVSAVVPNLLSRLQVQDRLGLVIVGNDGSRAYINPQKPTWSGWPHVHKMEMYSLDYFIPTGKGVIEAALMIMKSSLAKNKTIIVISDCISEYFHQNEVPVHTVGFADYDVNLLKLTSSFSSNARFQHADSIKELIDCVCGLFSAQKYISIQDVSVSFEIPYGMSLAGKFSGTALDKNRRFYLDAGSILRGHSQTFIFELEWDELSDEYQYVKDLLVTAKSVTTGEAIKAIPLELTPKWNTETVTMVPNSFVFGRVSRIMAEVVEHYIELVSDDDLQESTLFITRAIESCHDLARQNIDTCDQEDSIEWQKVDLLAESLKQLKFEDVSKLYEAREILKMQYSVRGHSLLDRIFFESLDFNII